ncbi:winged helix-turn-helix transcriptional regulator [Pseudoalteromonas sp. A25]|uniref:winged helix-turn-helix transcriptional regulator n=1 Tax=Pseudoalteromonas sp. A25 TaxID=116092 RepID=UPI001260991C|nr:helix-turn-helix domain-containing protein [Pseudoalteromonas sp. A25]
MINKDKKVERKVGPQESARMVEVLVGCKWSLTVYQLLAAGINRPGEMVRKTHGLTTKVLNQCLKKNVEFGVLKKQSFAEIPPRVEYEVTELGEQFLSILNALEQLQQQINQAQ